MNLSDITYKDQYRTGMQTNTTSGAVHATTESAVSGNQNLLTLQPGQQIRGTVVAMDGDRVSIQTQEHQVFSARLENGVNLENGMTLSFEVKGIQGNQISLTPLYSNLTASSSVMKALQMADLPVTESSVRMVNEMMNQGMSIDKQSLQSMFHLAGQYDGTDAATLVQMKQFQLPISEANIEQFESYKNNTAQILEGYQQIGSEVTGLMQEMASKGDYEGLGKMFTEIMKTISADSLMQNEAQGTEQTSNGQTAPVNSGVLPGMPEGANVAPGTNGNAGAITGENANAAVIDGSTAQKIIITADGIVQSAEQTLMDSVSSGTQGETAAVSNDTEATANGTADVANAANTGNAATQATGTDGAGKALEALMQAIRQANEQDITAKGGTATQNTVATASGNESAQMLQTQVPVEEQFQDFVNNLLEQTKGATPEQLSQIYKETGMKLSQLMKNPEFEDVFQKSLSKEWLLKPQDVSEKEQVQGLYEKVLRQTAALEQILADAGQRDSAAMKSVQNMTRNVEFLNDLNQNFALLQLPLKMSEQNAHGELYVYTKKRNMASKDGPVTALLHLAMDHLGDMDIYVAMQNHKVSTKFYLESEEVIDFLEGHMEELDRKLMQKGYSMKSELLHKDHKDNGNVFDELIADSKSRGRAPMVMVSRQSFDARA